MFSPLHPCLTPPLGGSRQDFWMKPIPQKTRGMGLLYGKYCVILAIAYMHYSIYAVAHKNEQERSQPCRQWHLDQTTCHPARSARMVPYPNHHPTFSNNNYDH